MSFNYTVSVNVLANSQGTERILRNLAKGLKVDIQDTYTGTNEYKHIIVGGLTKAELRANVISFAKRIDSELKAFNEDLHAVKSLRMKSDAMVADKVYVATMQEIHFTLQRYLDEADWSETPKKEERKAEVRKPNVVRVYRVYL